MSYVKIVGVQLLRSTPNAVLVKIVSKEYWIPESQIHDDSEIYPGSQAIQGNLICTTWVAEQRGLDGFGEEYEE